jgi:hypothetical protein
VHIAFEFAAALAIIKLFGGFGDDGVAVVIQPVDQRADRRKLLIFNDCRILERAQNRAAALEFLQQAFVVDIETERPGCRVKICAIDEQRNIVGGRWH